MGLLTNWIRRSILDNPRGRRIAAAIMQPGTMLTQESPRSDMHGLLTRFVGDVYSCVNLIATQLGTFTTPHVFVHMNEGERLKNPHKNCSSALFKQIEKDPMLPSGSRDQFLELTNHPLISLFKNINPWWTNCELFEILSTLLDMTGEAYLFMHRGMSATQKPDEVWPLMPQWMTPRYDDPMNINSMDALRGVNNGTPVNTPNNQMVGAGAIRWWQYGPASDPVPLSVDEVIRIRRPSPYQQIRGLAPMLAGVDLADSSIMLRKYQKGMLNNRGVPDVIVRLSGEVDEKKIERFKSDWQNSFGQFAGGSGGVAVIPADQVEIEPLGFKPKDMETIKASKDLRELICNIFHVPITMMTQESSNRSTAEADLYKLAKLVIEPRLIQLQQNLNGVSGITRFFGDPDRLFLVFDDPVPEDKEFTIRLRESNLTHGVTNPNTERGFMGMEPREGGDEYVDITKKGMAAPAPQQDNKPPDKSSTIVIEKTIPGENTPGQKPEVGGLEGLLIRTFDHQETEIVMALERMGIVSKSSKRDAALIWQTIGGDEILSEKSLSDEARPFFRVGFESGARQGKQDMLNLNLSFEMPEPEALDALDNNLVRFSKKFAKNVNDTTRRAIMNQLSEGLSQGDTIPDLANRIRGVYAQATKSRAETIARSESKRAIEAGREVAYKETGLVKQVEWLASDGACEFCKKLDGKRLTLSADGSYLEVGEELTGINGGKMTNKYLKVRYPPLHPNCTCTTLAVIGD